MINIDTETKNETLIINLSGSYEEIILTRPLSDTVKIVETGIQQVVLDFEKVHFLASCGLRDIITFASILEKRKIDLVLRKISKEIHEIFILTALEKCLKIE
ncbi:MAG: STAS domain-containing protein [Planctomycetia bacterium]|nr:STAS domain-containing protein [Planctomycetia bacterium]